MANKTPQTFANHPRVDPPFHYVQGPLAMIAVILSLIFLFRNPGWVSVLLVILSIGFLLASFRLRIYSLKVQDRVIRLEERLRLAMLLPDSARPRIGELTKSQLVALRFASDEELPTLAMRALNEGLTSKQIKSAIQNWRGDYLRV
ncbi:MAG: DUF6526 family protein [Acidobacteriaceae bacterium]